MSVLAPAVRSRTAANDERCSPASLATAAIQAAEQAIALVFEQAALDMQTLAEGDVYVQAIDDAPEQARADVHELVRVDVHEQVKVDVHELARVDVLEQVKVDVHEQVIVDVHAHASTSAVVLVSGQLKIDAS